MIDLSNTGIGGGLVVALALYAAGSVVAGQVIGKRMVAISGWHVTCPDGIKSAARPVRPPRTLIPEQRCSELASHLGPFAFDAMHLCHQFGNPDFNAMERRAEREARKRQKQLDDARVAQAAKSAGSQCACADQVYRSDKTVALGVYAGSARQITLPGIADLETGLRQALGAPQCQALGSRS